LKRLISHILYLSILIASFPMLPTNVFATNCTSQIHFEKRKACDGTEDDNPILVWSEERCDCVESEDSQEFNEQFNACAENKDLDETQRMNCYMSNALGESGLSSCGGFLENDDDLKSSKNNGKELTGNDKACMESLGLPSSAENWTSRMSMINTVLSVIMLFGFNNKKNDNNMCSSAKWMIAASVAGVANELINYFLFESDIRDLQVRFYEEALCDTSLSKEDDSFSSTTRSENESDVSGGCADKDPLQAQVDAFNYLVEERTISSEIHNKKMWGYIATGGLYLIAIAVGIYDLVSSLGAKASLTCYFQKPTSKSNILDKITEQFFPAATATSNTFQSNLTSGDLGGFDQFFKVKRYSCQRSNDCGIGETCQSTDDDYRDCMKCMRNSISGKINSETEENKEAAGVNCEQYERPVWQYPIIYQILLGGAAVATGILAFGDKLNMFGGILIGQIIISGIAAVLAFFSAHNNRVASNEAERHASLISGVQEEFIGAIVLNCPNGREDPNVLECYCFNKDGSRRQDRSQSESCQSMFSSLDQQFKIESHDLTLGQKSIKPTCITIDGNPDPDCNCQKFSDSKTGRNACFQVPITSGNIGNILTGTGADKIAASANALSGSGNTKDLNNTNGLFNAAKNLTSTSKKLLKKLNNTLKQKGTPEIDLNQKKIAAIGQAIATPRLLSSIKSSSPAKQFEKARESALTKAKSKIKKAKAVFSGGKNLSFNKQKSKKAGMNFDFAQNGSGAKTKNFMDKKYKYKKDDIIKNNSASIWKVITNRYNNSGYSRLFKD